MSLGEKPAQYQTQTPPDLQGLRQQITTLLGSFLSPNGQGGSNLDAFFGPMGSPLTGLQQQSTDAIGKSIAGPAPEQQAFDMASPAIQAILNGKPGQGVIDALQPTFQKNLAQADQQGGRFGSANAVLRSNALNDFNLLGANAAQQGQQTQLQAAQMLNMLGTSAGQNPFSRLLGAYGVGQNNAQQGDLQTQRHLQLLNGLFGMGAGASLSSPTVQTQPYDPGLGHSLLNGLLGAGFGGLGSWVGKHV